MTIEKYRTIKPEIRVLGIDDGAFTPHSTSLVTVVGVIFRGGYWLDGVIHTQVEVDGYEATSKIASMITGSPHHKQLRVTMLNGITLGGFNVVDIKKLNMKTKVPVVAVTREKPNLACIKAALRNLPKSKERWEAIKNAGEILEVPTEGGIGKIYMQIAGLLEEDAERILLSTSTRSNIPEALRVAHLIASGISAV